MLKPAKDSIATDLIVYLYRHISLVAGNSKPCCITYFSGARVVYNTANNTVSRPTDYCYSDRAFDLSFVMTNRPSSVL